jgi:hypothetical protein
MGFQDYDENAATPYYSMQPIALNTTTTNTLLPPQCLNQEQPVSPQTNSFPFLAVSRAAKTPVSSQSASHAGQVCQLIASIGKKWQISP